MPRVGEQYGLYTVKEDLTTKSGRICCRATDPFLGQDVFLHLLTLPKKFNNGHLQSLQQRLDALAKLDHPTLAPIYDIGNEKGTCYYTTTFFEKGHLLERLSSMKEKDGLWILKGFGEGLAYAHVQGFEHGPILAEDLYLNEGGLPVLANFGVSALMSDFSKDKKGIHDTESLQKQAFSSLGQLFLSMVLKKEQLSLEPSEQVQLLKGDGEKRLIRSLLGLSEEKISDYGDLFRRLTALLPTKSAAETSNGKVSPIEKTSPVKSAQSLPGKGSTEALVRKLAKESSSDIRDLVTEKAKLQIRLEEEEGGRVKAERKLAMLEQALSSSQRAEEVARLEAKTAWQNVDSQRRKRIYPALYLVLGCFAGALLTFFLSDRPTYVSTDQIPQKIMSERVPVSAIIPETQNLRIEGAEESQQHTESSQPETINPFPEETTGGEKVASSVPQIEEVHPEETEWLPAGSEFQEENENSLAFSEGSTAELTAAEKTKILGLIQGWVWSWENQNIAAYLSHYSSDFDPGSGRTREEWRAIRKKRLAKPEWIEVELDGLLLSSIGLSRAQVQMTQIYRSDFYGDQTLKVLGLIREGDSWKICEERALESRSDQIGG